MKVYLLSVYPSTPGTTDNFTCRWLREAATLDPFGRHHIVDDPAEADLILFGEHHPAWDPYLLKVSSHPVYRQFRGKCILYHDADYAVPVLRGIYPSIRRRDYQADRCRSGGYIARMVPNEAVRYDPTPVERKWLYSFFGEANAPIRRALFARPHPQGQVKDTTGRRHWQMEDGPEKEAFFLSYAEAIRSSRFVLCPAGLGPTTYRLFETMEMGRVPVILSDEWVAPQGPAWEEFSLRVPENAIGNLEVILAGRAPHYEEMGRLARQNWEQWFAPPVCFHRLVETALEIKAEPRRPLSALRARMSLLRSTHFLHWLRPHVRSLKKRVANVLAPRQANAAG